MKPAFKKSLRDGALFATAFILPIVFGAAAATANALSQAEMEGRNLAQQLCEARPAGNITNTGTLKVRDGKGERTEMPVKFEIIVTATNWTGVYETMPPTNVTDSCRLVVTRDASGSNHYQMSFHPGHNPEGRWTKDGSEDVACLPFAGDFLAMDFGLEFFHWPGQRVLKKEVKRSRGCTVLESTNPQPATNSYLRVVSWIDHESGGIVQAEAYDSNNKLLKEFAPKSFKKVNGQWQLQEMEIRNVRTGSRTRLELNLGAE